MKIKFSWLRMLRHRNTSDGDGRAVVYRDGLDRNGCSPVGRQDRQDRLWDDRWRAVRRGSVIQGHSVRADHVAESLRPKPTGAEHSTELPFLFSILEVGYGEAATPKDRAKAHIFMGYIAGFAKTGDPNRSGLPSWPRYDLTRSELMMFTPDAAALVQVNPWKSRLDLIKGAVEAQAALSQVKVASWLDDPKPASWNTPDLPLPAAPRVQENVDPRCRTLARPAGLEEDKRLRDQGWDLVGAYQGGWQIVVIHVTASYDGMCRPR